MKTTGTAYRRAVIADVCELDRGRLSGPGMPSCATRRHIGAAPEPGTVTGTLVAAAALVVGALCGGVGVVDPADSPGQTSTPSPTVRMDAPAHDFTATTLWRDR